MKRQSRFKYIKRSITFPENTHYIFEIQNDIFNGSCMPVRAGIARRSADLRCQGVPAYEDKSLERRDALLKPRQEGFLPHSSLRGITWVPRRDEGAPCSGEEPFCG